MYIYCTCNDTYNEDREEYTSWNRESNSNGSKHKLQKTKRKKLPLCLILYEHDKKVTVAFLEVE